MVTKPANEQSQDFSIHNEDFPALPGSSYKDPTSSNDDNKSVSGLILTVCASYVHILFVKRFSQELFQLCIIQEENWALANSVVEPIIMPPIGSLPQFSLLVS